VTRWLPTHAHLPAVAEDPGQILENWKKNREQKLSGEFLWFAYFEVF